MCFCQPRYTQIKTVNSADRRQPQHHRIHVGTKIPHYTRLPSTHHSLAPRNKLRRETEDGRSDSENFRGSFKGSNQRELQRCTFRFSPPELDLSSKLHPLTLPKLRGLQSEFLLRDLKRFIAPLIELELLDTVSRVSAYQAAAKCGLTKGTVSGKFTKYKPSWGSEKTSQSWRSFTQKTLCLQQLKDLALGTPSHHDLAAVALTHLG